MMLALYGAGILALVLSVGFNPTFRELQFDRKSTRTYEAGDTITLTNGLTVTIPAGNTGWYEDFYRVPLWLPLGQTASGENRLELLVIKPIGASDLDADGAAFMSFYGPGRTHRLGMTGGSLIASSPTLDVYDLSPELSSYRIETSLPGHDAGVVYCHADTTVTAEVIREGWRYYSVQGADIPR